MVKKYDKSALMEILQVLGRFDILTVKACSETALFIERSTQDFHSLSFQKYIGYDGHLLFRNV